MKSPKRVIHPLAKMDYLEGVGFYRAEASREVSIAFTREVNAAFKEIMTDPIRWRVIEPPDIRRRVLKKFPYSIIYRVEDGGKQVTFYAVMHGSREPGYWRGRI